MEESLVEKSTESYSVVLKCLIGISCLRCYVQMVQYVDLIIYSYNNSIRDISLRDHLF